MDRCVCGDPIYEHVPGVIDGKEVLVCDHHEERTMGGPQHEPCKCLCYEKET
jgi:hypothetical protein